MDETPLDSTSLRELLELDKRWLITELDRVKSNIIRAFETAASDREPPTE